MRWLNGFILSFIIGVWSPAATAQVGQLDPGFGSGGVVVSDVADLDHGFDAHVQADGSVVAVGSTSGPHPGTRSATMFFFDSNGTPESNRFFENAVFGCSVPEVFYAIAEEADGNLLAGGYAQFDCGGSMRDFCVVRTNPDGTELLRFDRPVFHGVIGTLRDLVVQLDGKVIGVGFAGTSGRSRRIRSSETAGSRSSTSSWVGGFAVRDRGATG